MSVVKIKVLPTQSSNYRYDPTKTDYRVFDTVFTEDNDGSVSSWVAVCGQDETIPVGSSPSLTNHYWKLSAKGAKGDKGDKGNAGGSSDILLSNHQSLDDAISAAKAANKALIIDKNVNVTNTPNFIGIPSVEGFGDILLGGAQKLNSYADLHKHYFGVEYLAAFHQKIINGTALKVVLSGDSTTAGTSTSGRFTPAELIKTAASKLGINNQAVVNRGQPGKHAGDWDATYVAADIAEGPDLLIVRWGINDPYYNRTFDQFVASYESALAKVRAALPLTVCSIMIMAPNSTSDTPGKRDEKWYEKIVPALRQLARKYQCAFFDTYALAQDSRHAASLYMDDPYSDGRAVHPLNVLNVNIYSHVARVLYPDLLNSTGSSGGVVNLTNASKSDAKPGDLAGSYPLGVSIYRAKSADGWPNDGAVMTVRQADGAFAMQMIWSYSVTTSTVKMRNGTAVAWSDWQESPKASSSVDLTLLNGWVSYAASYAAKLTSKSGINMLQGLIKGGSLTADTVIANVGAAFLPSQSKWFTAATDTTPAVLYLTTAGDLKIKSAPANIAFLSLDNICW